MGNDGSPALLLNALRATDFGDEFEIIAIGSPDLGKSSSHFLHSSPDFITMDDSPVHAVKKKKDASMMLGLQLLKEKKLDAFVSSGNTGALVLGASLILSTLPGILRPAFLSQVPTQKKPVAVLDLGANIECKSAHLVQFALMASAYLNAKGIQNPKIGLLNIGEEPLKGTSEIRLAYNQLKTLEAPPFQFVGNIEGKSVFEGNIDALITDGFTGNIFLKTAEGLAHLILNKLQGTSQFLELKEFLNYQEHPGALLLGVQGLVMKCHGDSNPHTVVLAIKEAASLLQKNFFQTFHLCKF